jgi:hypothetical protein
VRIIYLKISLKNIIHKITLALIQKLVFPEKKQITEAQLKKNHQIENFKILVRANCKILILLEKEENKIVLINYN